MLGQALADAISELTATDDGDQKDECAAQALHHLNELLALASPALTRERLLAATDLRGGKEVNRWSLQDIERDRDRMEVARFVVADVLDRLPKLFPAGWSLGLSVALRELNGGHVRPFTAPHKSRGGASFASQRAKEQLGVMFWQRHPPAKDDRAPTVQLFAQLTGLDERTIYEAAAAVGEGDRNILQQFAALPAGQLVAPPGPAPLLATDEVIMALGKRIRRLSRRKVR
jgi:hypothetical protein